MSTVDIKVDLPPESQALIRGFQKLPDEVPQAIKRGMDRALQIVRGRIQENRLSGIGPYPSGERRLGEVTGLLRGSVRAEPAVIQGNQVVGSIGTNVIYGRVHEFGMTIYPRVAKYLVFKIAGKTIFAKRSVIPERAPFRTGVTENVDFIAGEISGEIEKSLENLSK
jgi:phage gpG-like protein